MNNLPCKDCICLAICKNLYHSFTVEMRFTSLTPITNFLNTAEIKCSLIGSYIYDLPTADIIERMETLENYMKGLK